MLSKTKLKTPGSRHWIGLNRSIFLKTKRLKALTVGYKRQMGRNNRGHITSWHRGGGHKASYRYINPLKLGLGVTIGKEYRPRITGFIDRIFFPDFTSSTFHISQGAENQYILGVQNLHPGSIINSSKFLDSGLGSHLSLKNIPSGFTIHNLSWGPQKGPQYLRAAGSFGILIQKTEKIARIKLKSGSQQNFPIQSFASIGSVSNEQNNLQNFGKAGKKRHLGRRPITRGVAMNPVDHPHGGGEGKTSGGRPSVTPWGRPTKGQPTVKNKKK
jgi:large subunit ribosomal protein L2